MASRDGFGSGGWVGAICPCRRIQGGSNPPENLSPLSPHLAVIYPHYHRPKFYTKKLDFSLSNACKTFLKFFHQSKSVNKLWSLWLPTEKIHDIEKTGQYYFNQVLSKIAEKGRKNCSTIILFEICFLDSSEM